MLTKHIPVLLAETTQQLKITKNQNIHIIDATFGMGGHSLRFARIIGKNGKIFGFEKDEKTFAEVTKNKFTNITIFNKSYAEMLETLPEYEDKIDAILFDLGVSSMQLDEAERGFSFMHDGPLDMRFSKKQTKTAEYVVNKYPLEELKNIIKNYGEEKFAGKIAKAICYEREKNKITTTKQLENIIFHSVHRLYEKKKHPATRTFQAIRIETNDEFKTIEAGIENAVKMLKSGGRFAVISFHSLEDKIVKNKLKELANTCICPPKLPVCLCKHKPKIKIITPKPIHPTDEEIKNNYRSRSSILRVAEKI